MPQLLHFLKVDQQTRLSAPVADPASAAAATTTGTEGDEDGEDNTRTAVPLGGRVFFNQSDTVRTVCLPSFAKSLHLQRYSNKRARGVCTGHRLGLP